MRNLVILSDCDDTIKVINLPHTYSIDIVENNDVIFVNFVDGDRKNILHTIMLFVDNDEEPERDFENYTEKGQRTILSVMRNYIVEDIMQFLSDPKDEEYYEIYPLEHQNIFVSEEFEKRWYAFYDFIIDSDIMSYEYVKPETEDE